MYNTALLPMIKIQLAFKRAMTGKGTILIFIILIHWTIVHQIRITFNKDYICELFFLKLFLKIFSNYWEKILLAYL